MKTFSILAAIALWLGGCANIDPAALASADYGPFPDNYQELIKDHVGPQLKDPESARYRFTEPVKGYIRKAPIQGGKPANYGYVATVWVNAKNGFGGYTGEQGYRFLLKNGVVMERIYPNPQYFKEPWYQ